MRVPVVGGTLVVVGALLTSFGAGAVGVVAAVQIAVVSLSAALAATPIVAAWCAGSGLLDQANAGKGRVR